MFSNYEGLYCVENSHVSLLPVGFCPKPSAALGKYYGTIRKRSSINTCQSPDARATGPRPNAFVRPPTQYNTTQTF